MKTSTPHPVIWRELHTTDIDGAKTYYGRLLGWRFQTEKAARFVWGEGAGAYHLIESGGEIHGGMALLGGGGAHWLSYVRVADVDAALDRAEALGGTVIRGRFDVPGVGVNAVIADPRGARIGIAAPSYAYPYPAGVFLRDHLFTDDPAGAAAFYNDLFGWTLSEKAALGVSAREGGGASAWTPVLAVSRLDAALARAAELGGVIQRVDGLALAVDPQGAVAVLETQS